MKKLTGARYTWKQMLRALHKLGYSLKVLKHRAAAQDKDKVERARFLRTPICVRQPPRV